MARMSTRSAASLKAARSAAPNTDWAAWYLAAPNNKEPASASANRYIPPSRRRRRKAASTSTAAANSQAHRGKGRSEASRMPARKASESQSSGRARNGVVKSSWLSTRGHYSRGSSEGKQGVRTIDCQTQGICLYLREPSLDYCEKGDCFAGLFWLW